MVFVHDNWQNRVSTSTSWPYWQLTNSQKFNWQRKVKRRKVLLTVNNMYLLTLSYFRSLVITGHFPTPLTLSISHQTKSRREPTFTQRNTFVDIYAFPVSQSLITLHPDQWHSKWKLHRTGIAVRERYPNKKRQQEDPCPPHSLNSLYPLRPFHFLFHAQVRVFSNTQPQVYTLTTWPYL